MPRVVAWRSETRCARIAANFGFQHLSAGDLLREAASRAVLFFCFFLCWVFLPGWQERKRPGSELGELIESHIKDKLPLVRVQCDWPDA